MQFNLEWLGWVATSLFTLSFVFKRQIWLLRLQMTSACLWMTYGFLRHDRPVVVANVLVASAALASQLRMAWDQRTEARKKAEQAAAVVPAAARQ